LVLQPEQHWHSHCLFVTVSATLEHQVKLLLIFFFLLLLQEDEDDMVVSYVLCIHSMSQSSLGPK